MESDTLSESELKSGIKLFTNVIIMQIFKFFLHKNLFDNFSETFSQLEFHFSTFLFQTIEIT